VEHLTEAHCTTVRFIRQRQSHQPWRPRPTNPLPCPRNVWCHVQEVKSFFSTNNAIVDHSTVAGVAISGLRASHTGRSLQRIVAAPLGHKTNCSEESDHEVWPGGLVDQKGGRGGGRSVRVNKRWQDCSQQEREPRLQGYPYHRYRCKSFRAVDDN
jgi:hypothetical protein